MTDKHFDNLTKLLSGAASRRSVLKGIVAAAVGGVLVRAGGEDAEATRSRRACSRLHEVCGGDTGFTCCPHLACGEDGSCCKPENENCLEDTDCCAGDVCRPNPSGLGMRCLPPGLFGAECVEGADCASGLCDAYTGTCADNGCVDCSNDPYMGMPSICGADSRTNDICACYPSTDQSCACTASLGCDFVSVGCSSSDECAPGETCLLPVAGETDLCELGNVGVCALLCDYQGDAYIIREVGVESVGGWY